MDTNAVLDALRQEVPVEIYRRNPAEVLRASKRGSCVQATRMGVEALKYFGVEAKPLVTLAITGNAAWVEWMKLEDPDAPWSDEVWSVGTDPNLKEGERGYPAHLVIEIDGQLLDLDAGFSARPEKGIHVPATVLLPLTEFGAGIDLDEGGVLLYRRHSTKVDYRQSGAWRNSQKWAGPVIRRMRDRLADAA